MPKFPVIRYEEGEGEEDPTFRRDSWIFGLLSRPGGRRGQLKKWKISKYSSSWAGIGLVVDEERWESIR